MQVPCSQSSRRIHNNLEVINHFWFWNPVAVNDEVSGSPQLAAVNEVDNNLNGTDDAVTQWQFFWENAPANQAVEKLKECYGKIVF